MHKDCQKEADAVAASCSFVDPLRREIGLDDFAFHVFSGLTEQDDWPREIAAEFVRELRAYIEEKVTEIEAMNSPRKN